MAIRPSETYELVSDACSFPTERDAVVDRVGETTLTSPNGESVTLESVLARSQETRYDSARHLHTTVLSYLDDDYVGRKAYDDRSRNPGRDADVSF
jgi:hypothetical protein